MSSRWSNFLNLRCKSSLIWWPQTPLHNFHYSETWFLHPITVTVSPSLPRWPSSSFPLIKLVMVNVMFHFDQTKGCPDSWYYFWVCLWVYSRKRFKSVDWIKNIYPHQCGWASFDSWKAQIKQQYRGRTNSLSSLAGIANSWPQTLKLLVLGPLDWDWITPLTFLLLQLADSSRLCHTYASIIICANFHKKSPHIYPIGSVSLENPD